MKAFVTGATGFIGSHLVDELLLLGFDVTCLIRKTSNLKWLEGKKINFVTANISESQLYSNYLEDTDYIFHVAGVTFGKKKEDFLRGNYEDTRTLMENVKKHSVKLKRFVFISSQTVSGPASSLENPKNENSNCKPITTYGKSKKLAEDEVMKYMKDIPVTALRVSAVFGPRDNAILAVFKSVKMGLAAIVGVKEKKYLNLIYIKDLVNGIIKSSQSEKAIGQIYFLASEEIYTWDKLIPLIAEKLGRKFLIKLRLPHFLVLLTAAISEFFNIFSRKPSVFNYEKGMDFIQNYWICSVEKAKNDFDFKQNTPIEVGIEETINWYREYKWL